MYGDEFLPMKIFTSPYFRKDTKSITQTAKQQKQNKPRTLKKKQKQNPTRGDSRRIYLGTDSKYGGTYCWSIWMFSSAYGEEAGA